MSGSIRVQAPPNMIGLPQINLFDRNDFNQALWENGYDVTLEEAVVCPCKGTSSDAKVTCSNCLGTGWVFVNPIQTKAFISSINKSTKYKDWSPEMIGTIAITFMNVNRFSFMDKIVLNKNYGLMSEALLSRDRVDPNYPKFIFTTYKVIEIRSIFLYNDDDHNLIKLSPADYRINSSNKYVIDLKTDNFPVYFNGRVSVSYKHNVTYNIVDIPHDMRITKNYDNNGTKEIQEMPVQAIARKAQYELGSATNYAGNNILNNSYL